MKAIARLRNFATELRDDLRQIVVQLIALHQTIMELHGLAREMREEMASELEDIRREAKAARATEERIRRAIKDVGSLGELADDEGDGSEAHQLRLLREGGEASTLDPENQAVGVSPEQRLRQFNEERRQRRLAAEAARA